jgi:hypothetical protein
MNEDDVTITRKGDGIVECRICGLNFMPELQEDRERHEREHLNVLAGGLPYDVREFIKKAAWKILDNEDLRESAESLERAKRALAFAYWSRAISNSIPENELQPYMAAYFAWLDARGAHDEEAIERTAEALKRWNKYG